MTPLCLRDFTVAYEEHDVLSRLSLDVPSGVVTALVGPNGSGKSTLLRAVADLHRPREGAVSLDGRQVVDMHPRELARTLSFLPQAPLIPEGITVRELVEYGRYPHRGPFGRRRPDDAAAVEWALDVTSTTPFADRPVDHLSGGERQRAWIAMALAQRTGLLLLDEPTTYLDIRYQVEVLDLVRGLVDDHGLTVVLVLHDLNQAAAYADRMVLLHDGAIAAQGTPCEVLDRLTISDVFGLDVTVETDSVTGVPTCHFYGRRAAART
jgi:iron complex transport system ATP-binding protein